MDASPNGKVAVCWAVDARRWYAGRDRGDGGQDGDDEHSMTERRGRRIKGQRGGLLHGRGVEGMAELIGEVSHREGGCLIYAKKANEGSRGKGGQGGGQSNGQGVSAEGGGSIVGANGDNRQQQFVALHNRFDYG